MPVSKADANGAARAVAGNRTDTDGASALAAGAVKGMAALAVAQGCAASPGGNLPAIPLATVDKAFGRVIAASRRLAAEPKKPVPPGDSPSVTEAQMQLQKADLALRVSILDVTSRLSRPSTLSPLLRDDGDQRRLGDCVVAAYDEAGDQVGHIRTANRENQRARAIIGLSALSDAVKRYNGELDEAQIAEADDIVADASNWVTEPRDGEGPNARFERLAQLLKNIVTFDLTFSPGVFDALVARINRDMHIEQIRDRDRFDAIVKAEGAWQTRP